jgi:hypothetical protein
MVSRQGICAFNDIVRRGQAGPRHDGLAAGSTGFVLLAALIFRRIALSRCRPSATDECVPI